MTLTYPSARPASPSPPCSSLRMGGAAFRTWQTLRATLTRLPDSSAGSTKPLDRWDLPVADTPTPTKLAGARNPRWAFMEPRFEAPDYDHPERTYLTRWRLIQTPWFGIYLHRMDGPDPRSTLHNHPWSFLSIIMRGGYVERVPDPDLPEIQKAESFYSGTLYTANRRVRRWNRKRADDYHSIVGLNRQPTWTLFIVGPRQERRWSYLSDGYTVTPFDEHPHSEDFAKALAARKAMRRG